MSALDLVAIILVLTATFGWINHQLIGLPNTIGMLVIGLLASLAFIGIEVLLPGTIPYKQVGDVLAQIDFQETVLNGMLAFLLFAGALHVDLGALRSRVWAVSTLAVFGTALSTVLVGVGFWAASGLLGLQISLAWALVFGALISPTDPLAVLSMLKAVQVPASLEIDITGESLFNDGVGVVFVTVLVGAAVSQEGGGIDLREVGELFLVDAVGGAVLGLATGYLAYRAMRALDDYSIEVLISLAVATGTYALAGALHMSGPIAVVVAGLLIGNRGPKDAMSEETQHYLFGFWTLIDEILNSVLFLLIGLEVLVLPLKVSNGFLAALAVPLVLFARFVAVSLPVVLLRPFQPFVRGTIAVMTWGGLRGGISVALALSLPATAEKPLIITATYAVVLFTIIGQGLSLRALVSRVVR